MCHKTCNGCKDESNKFQQCTSCFESRFFFDNSCLCPKGQDDGNDYKCREFDDKVDTFQDFIYALQWGLLTLMIISLFAKRNIPLTRKLIDVCQTIGLLFYFHQYYNPKIFNAFQLFQMTNLSSLIQNYIANRFFGQKMYQSSSSYIFLNMDDEEQIPPYKKAIQLQLFDKIFITDILIQRDQYFWDIQNFLYLKQVSKKIKVLMLYQRTQYYQYLLIQQNLHIYIYKQQKNQNQFKYINYLFLLQSQFYLNGKSSNFLMNQLQVFIMWFIGLVIFILVGGAISIIKSGKGFCEYIRFNIMNYVYIIFYFTFQESILNVFLQLDNLKWTQVIHYASLAAMAGYIVFALLIIRNMLVSQNTYPSDQIQRKIEMFRRRDCHHFLFAFEDPLTDTLILQKSEKTKLSPTELMVSNWVVLSLIQKVVMTGVIVYQYDQKVEISMIVIIIIFFKLFFFLRPIKNKLILFFSFLADVYTIIVIILSEKDYIVYLLWPGIIILNTLMIVEDVLSNKFYDTTKDLNYLEKLNQVQNQQIPTVLSEKNVKNIVIQENKNQQDLVQNGKDYQDKQNNQDKNNQSLNQLNQSDQIPFRNESQGDQSILNNKENSMMQQNIIQFDPSQVEKLETIQDNQNQNNNQINDNRNQNQYNSKINSISALKQSQGMIEMKQKYIDKIKKQNDILLKKSYTHNQSQIQEQNNSKINNDVTSLYDPYGFQKRSEIKINQQNKSLDLQQYASLTDRRKSETQNKNYFKRSLNDFDNINNQNKQTNNISNQSSLRNKQPEVVQANKKEEESSYDSDEEFEEEFIKNQPISKISPSNIKEQSNASQKNKNTLINPLQKNSQLQVNHINNQKDIAKSVKQQQIEQELSQNWNFE